MQQTRGVLTLEELTARVRSGAIDTVVVAFTDVYGRLVGKRLDAEFFLESAAEHGTHACNYLLTVDMEMEPVPGYKSANWERGYGDFHLVPDLATLRVADWLEKTAVVLCNLDDEGREAPVEQGPRSILKRQIDRLAESGFEAFTGSELEYYTFVNSYRDAHQAGYAGLEPAGWYIEDYHVLQSGREEKLHGTIRRHLARSGIPVEATKGEWGLGQHELNLHYTNVLTMADSHILFKQCAKEVADRLGVSVTFMAKYASDRAGSSCHLHLSLWNGGANAFAGGQSDGQTEVSKVFRWFLGGWIAHTAELMVFYSPTINSYKRYQPGSWAPTRLAWSYDNRTAGFRVLGKGPGLRIECRIPGADCNPYLAYAAALASGLDGIQNQTETPPLFIGDAYAARDVPHVPRTLPEATDLFENSAFARTAFGDDVVDHYTHFFRSEQSAFDKAVTDWERQRYFERI